MTAPTEVGCLRSPTSTDRPAVRAFVEEVLSQLAALAGIPFVHLGGEGAFGMPTDQYERFVDRAVGVVLGSATGRGLAGRRTGPSRPGRKRWSSTGSTSGALAGGGAAGGGAGDRLSPEVLDLLVAHFGDALGDLGRIAEKVRCSCSPTTTFSPRPAHGDRRSTQRRRRTGPARPAVLRWRAYARAAARLGRRRGDGAVPPERLAGVEAALWCETVRVRQDLELLLLPAWPASR